MIDTIQQAGVFGQWLINTLVVVMVLYLLWQIAQGGQMVADWRADVTRAAKKLIAEHLATPEEREKFAEEGRLEKLRRTR